MRTIIFLGALFLISTSSLAVEIIYKDSDGNVLKDICGLKRNPDVESIYTHIPYTQAECSKRAEFRELKDSYSDWRTKILRPNSQELNTKLQQSQDSFYDWVNKNKKGFKQRYGKMNWSNPYFLFTAYRTNVVNVFNYFVHYNAGHDGVKQFIEWFNDNGGFDLNHWQELCGNDHTKWVDCKGQEIKGSRLVKIETFTPYGETQFRNEYIYFGNAANTQAKN